MMKEMTYEIMNGKADCSPRIIAKMLKASSEVDLRLSTDLIP